MKINAYKLTFSYADPMKDGTTRAENTKVILANDDAEALNEAAYINSCNKEYDCHLENMKKVEHGKVWKVVMKGIAHHDEYERAEMEKTLFIDCKSMYDAEQVAYRLWERQIKEEGFSDISIWSTRVLPAESKKEAA
jgi:hypothetical protein